MQTMNNGLQQCKIQLHLVFNNHSVIKDLRGVNKIQPAIDIQSTCAAAEGFMLTGPTLCRRYSTIQYFSACESSIFPSYQ